MPETSRRERGRTSALSPIRSGATIHVLVVCTLAGAGCDSVDDGRRSYSPVSWDTVFQFSQGPADTSLLIPRLLTSDGERLYVYDYGDNALKALDVRSMDRIWAVGRGGKGPLEFENAVDMEIGHGGNLWIVDGGAGRIVVYDSLGNLVRTIPLGDHLVRDVLPLRGQVLVTSYAPTDLFLFRIDTTGHLVEPGPFPVSGSFLDSPHLMARATNSTLSASSESAWISIFPFGESFMIHDGRSLRCSGRLIEGEPFPEEAPRGLPPVWAVKGVLGDSLAYILPRGETEADLEVLDVYSARNCEYRHTVRLPGPMSAMTLSECTFFFEYEQPRPGILGLRPRDGCG